MGSLCVESDLRARTLIRADLPAGAPWSGHARLCPFSVRVMRFGAFSGNPAPGRVDEVGVLRAAGPSTAQREARPAMQPLSSSAAAAGVEEGRTGMPVPRDGDWSGLSVSRSLCAESSRKSHGSLSHPLHASVLSPELPSPQPLPLDARHGRSCPGLSRRSQDLKCPRWTGGGGAPELRPSSPSKQGR